MQPEVVVAENLSAHEEEASLKMRWLLGLFLILVFRPFYSEAQTSRPNSGLDELQIFLFPLSTEGLENGEVGAEYLWHVVLGGSKLGGLGFLKVGFDKSVFTNHFLNFSPKKSIPIYFSSEQGKNLKGFFWRAGGRISLTSFPVLGKTMRTVFDNANIGYLRKVAGQSEPNEGVIYYQTRPLKIKPFSFSSEGFYRIRSVDRAEPQLWIGLDSFELIRVGAELDFVGGKAKGVSFGVRLNLK